MSFGELFAAALGWLGDLIKWIISFVPRYAIVRANQKAVRYVLGRAPTEVRPGVSWYWPWSTSIVVHYSNRDVLQLESMPLETKDGVKGEVGMVVRYRIVDVLAYEVDNFEPQANMAEVAQAGLRDIITEHSWEDLTVLAKDGTRFEQKLSRRMQETLAQFGVKVEGVRPTSQVRLDRALRVFGLRQAISVFNSGSGISEQA